ncbi:unnamed protein product [marine sediment metagenome]|uniref:Uncharacterized protein n=1 Tax=marine sediment metagenome TaxID=412755 RepID=X1TCR5_9ZZZZ
MLKSTNASSYISALSINMIHRCKREKISVLLLLNTIRLIDKGQIKKMEDLDNYLKDRIDSYPKYILDTEKIKKMLEESYILS